MKNNNLQRIKLVFNKYTKINIFIKLLIISIIIYFFFVCKCFFFQQSIINVEKKEIQKIIISKINNYILICRNGTLINGIKQSKNDTKISVVLTLYNSENTIKTSIRSIQNQNFTDLEIIIIDDYSTDKGYNIIKMLQKEDQRIKIIKNNKNRGALYSKSIGALNAKGKYIFPLDSDDLFVNENLFNFCFNEAEKSNIDILEFSGIECKNRIIPINNHFPQIPLYLKFKKNNEIIRSPKLRHFIYKKVKYKRFKLIDGFLWGKSIKSIIYKKALNLLGTKIYSQHICYGDDRIVIFFLFKVAGSFKFVKIYGIIHNFNRHSITNSHRKIKNCHDELINIMTIYNYTKNNKEVEIAVYEIIHRWKIIIYPGIKNKNNLNLLLNLINQMLNCKYINKSYKNILNSYYIEVLSFIL